MRTSRWILAGAAPIAAAIVAVIASGVGEADDQTEADAPTTPFVKKIPRGYRDWRLVSVAREEGDLKDIRAILGNDKAITAYRAGTLPFPEGAIIARLAWDHVPSAENNETFGKDQSFIAGEPKNGVQFMIKDSKKYASTGGWGYGHFDDGTSAADDVLETCFPCHRAVADRDYVFTRYSR
jgi:hypothetical protein